MCMLLHVCRMCGGAGMSVGWGHCSSRRPADRRVALSLQAGVAQEMARLGTLPADWDWLTETVSSDARTSKDSLQRV